MRYTSGAIVLHWLIAILIALNFTAAWVAEDLPKPEAMQVMGNHKAFGMAILTLTAVRILWRIANPPPPPSASLKTWEAGLAKAIHSLLYVLMVAVPLMGWAMHSAFTGAGPVPFFGLFAWPGLPLAQDKAMAGIFESAHGALATAMLALIALHVAAAFKHMIIDRDGEVKRMWFGKGKPE